MRILLVNHFPLEGSGSGTYVKNIALHLRKRGHSVYVISPENRSPREFSGIVHLPVMFSKGGTHPDALPFNFPCFTTHPQSATTFADLSAGRLVSSISQCSPPCSGEQCRLPMRRWFVIARRACLNVETYLFTAGDLREIAGLLSDAGLGERSAQLLSLFGYSNVRNMCLLAASILTADAVLLIDDDEVFETPDFVPRSLEFLGRRIYGDIVHGIAGYYLNGSGQYYDEVTPEPWMTYWDRFECKARAFDQIIGGGPRLKRTPFAFGGAMVLHRELFECVPFDPLVTRGEDIDYLVNSRMFRFQLFFWTIRCLSNTCPNPNRIQSGSTCARISIASCISVQS